MTRKWWCWERSSITASALAVLGMLLAAAVLPPVAVCGPQIPEWLTAATQTNIGDFGADAPAIILEQTEELDIDATGRFSHKERAAIRILNLRAAGPYLQAAGFENTDQSVKQIKTWTIQPNGQVVESDKKDVVTESAFAGFELFSDSRVKLVHAPAIQNGSVLGYEVITEGQDRLGSERFRLEAEIPVWLGMVRISVPSGSLRYFVNHPDRVEVADHSSNAATFRVRRRAGIPIEEDMPSLWSVEAAVFVNYDPGGNSAVQSWEDAGRKAYPFFRDVKKTTPEIDAELGRLTAGKAGMLQEMEAVSDFVARQIRYVAVEVGIGAFQPHPAAEVYQFRYGDCKDKATLLLTMLEKLGVTGYPALIGTRGRMEANPEAPSLTSFNHMIVAIPVPSQLRPEVERFSAYDAETQLLWVDPTSDSHPLGELPEMDQGVYSLIAYPDHGEIRRTPESPVERNGLEYDARLRLEPAGTGTAQVRVKYLGDANARRHSSFRSRSQSELRKMFEERTAGYATQVKLLQATITGVQDNRQPIIEEFSFSGDFSSAPSGESWLFQPLFLGGLAAPELGTKPRTQPFDIGAPYQIKGEYRIELPAGMKVTRLPEATSLDSEFGSLHISYSIDGNVLTIRHALAFSASRIPREKFSAFRDFVNGAGRLAHQRLRVAGE